MTADQLEEKYLAYIYDHANIGNGTMLINAMESGNYLDDFLDSIDMTLEQFEEFGL